jgi:glycosyltransferase involved in cell wall biosynthesis
VPTFNHEDFIETALNSVYEQQVTFRIKIVVFDDKSEDSTTSLLKKLAKDSPHPISIVESPTNLISIGKSPLLENLSQFKGKYIARLDGDDFWLTKDKLQHQVDLLESNPKVNVCATWTKKYDEEKSSFSELNQTVLDVPYPGGIVDSNKLVDGNFIANSSSVFRQKCMAMLPKSWVDLKVRDYALWGFISGAKGIGLVPEYSTAYREHKGNSWLSQSPELRRLQEYEAIFWIYENTKDPKLKGLWKRRLLLLHEHEINH